MDKQLRQEAEEAVAELPIVCDRGVKKNAKGYKESWNGYKLHADVNDAMLPLSVVITSASVHDSQVAIPLMKMTSNPRKGKALPMSPHEAKRYNERGSCERFNGRLKEDFGGRHVMVRGHAKVTMHLMFGVVALFADQLMKLTGY